MRRTRLLAAVVLTGGLAVPFLASVIAVAAEDTVPTCTLPTTMLPLCSGTPVKPAAHARPR
ncbi:hypothetical protein ACIBHY_18715 [Nonomuraea sp. NPDC050547]|uniref:hypothetical protein n=1 Tax=Nonomuraea sp. NPDC050547 TaxID=3364368 RepID=UPI00348AE8E5